MFVIEVVQTVYTKINVNYFMTIRKPVNHSFGLFGRAWTEVVGDILIDSNFTKYSDVFDFVLMQHVSSQPLYRHYHDSSIGVQFVVNALDTVSNNRIELIKDGVLDGLLLSYQTSLVPSTNTIQQNVSKPGDALKDYRSGKFVDWKKLAKDKYGG